jgi:hypothetical protein
VAWSAVTVDGIGPKNGYAGICDSDKRVKGEGIVACGLETEYLVGVGQGGGGGSEKNSDDSKACDDGPET